MIDAQSHRQLLLTRIAFERAQLAADVQRLGQAASLPAIVRSVAGPGFISDWFGKQRSPRAKSASGWLDLALTLLSRYRVAATLLGGIAPLLGGGRRWRRLLMAAVVGGAGYAGWWISRPGGKASL